MAEVGRESGTDREEALRDWFGQRGGAVPLVPVSGDASFRRYFRAASDERSVILCDAPPTLEKNAEFVAIAGALAAAGVRVPAVFAVDLERGFLALEDLGDRTLLPLLSPESVDAWYARALAMLERLATMDVHAIDLPVYDRQRLADEMALFPRWFCEELLQLPMPASEREPFDRLQTLLCDRALAQVAVVVHRDFHARNLMCLADDGLATIDFQDAVVGPVTYDPVSLLRDCYLRWPAQQVRAWALAHRQRLAALGLAVPAADAFLVDFDWMGLQRHIKVLGIFARLYRRDGKAGYLPDLPRVIGYLRDVLACYPHEPVLSAFLDWFEGRVMPKVREQPWHSPP